VSYYKRISLAGHGDSYREALVMGPIPSDLGVVVLDVESLRLRFSIHLTCKQARALGEALIEAAVPAPAGEGG
jgi:hypothetical protein